MNILKSNDTSISVISNSSDDTERIGAIIASAVTTKPLPCFFAMFGDLGAGKTAFVRGFAGVLSPGSRVKSPSYTIVNEYRKGSVPVFHFDFYRISSPDELYGIGFDDYLSSGYCIAEWCEKLNGNLPEGSISVNIIKQGENERLIVINGIPSELKAKITL